MLALLADIHSNLEALEACLDHARGRHLKVDPVCEYARSYMQRHPETMALHVDSTA